MPEIQKSEIQTLREPCIKPTRTCINLTQAPRFANAYFLGILIMTHSDSSFKIGGVEIPNRSIMAPMCGITHKPFRKLCKQYGAGLTVTQMVSAKALVMGCEKSKKLLSFDEAERPIAFQVFGNNADDLGGAAKIMQDMGADIVDLNMGCPAKKIVNDGGGSALLKDRSTTSKILERMRQTLKIPFTIKMRAGYDKYSDESLSMAKMAQDVGVDAIALHGRTKAQGYKGHSDWNLIKIFKAELKIPVIGNGDVQTFEDAHRMLDQTGCDAVMIGRAAVSAPWFFKTFVEKQNYHPLPNELRDIILNQYDLFFDFYGPQNGIKMMRKHLCAYTKGVRNGNIFRNKIITLDDWTVVKKQIEEFFHDALPA